MATVLSSPQKRFKNLRILIHGIDYDAGSTGVAKYTAELAQWLSGRGHAVRVVTAPPFYPQWRIQQPYKGWRYRWEPLKAHEAAITSVEAPGAIIRCPLWVPKRPNLVGRLVHLFSFALSSLPALLMQVFWNPSVVIVIEPTFLSIPGAWLAAQLCRAKTWLHIQDFELDAAFEMGIIRVGVLQQVASFVESQLLCRFSRVSTISERMLERLVKKKVAESRSVLFRNWVDTCVIAPLGTPSPFREELGISPDVKVALYSGNMGAKQGLEILPGVARLLGCRRDLVFVFCGDGMYRSKLQEASTGLSNVRFLPLQPVKRLNELLNLADVHLLPQRADAADLVMPSKLTGIMASGRPVIATAAPQTELARVVNGRGLVVTPGSARDMADALQSLLDDPSLARGLGSAARDYAVQSLDRNVVLREFERELMGICRDCKTLDGSTLGIKASD